MFYSQFSAFQQYVISAIYFLVRLCIIMIFYQTFKSPSYLRKTFLFAHVDCLFKCASVLVASIAGSDVAELAVVDVVKLLNTLEPEVYLLTTQLDTKFAEAVCF